MIANAVYENLLAVDPTTLDYIPVLATHWQISPDKMTFRFRMDPNARWSDGQPVVANDVVASWVFYTDKNLADPGGSQFTKIEKPVAESKYIVHVRAKTLDWKNFLSLAAAMPVFPAHVLKNVDAAAYLRDYNFKYLASTGPYIISESDIRKGKSISLRRRSDYWAEKARRNTGLNNFDEVRFVVVRDANLALEIFKKGDLDSVGIGVRAWLEQFNFDKVQRGLIQKQKIFNSSPQGFNGFAINTRRKPFDDIRVRKALTLLLNRQLMIEKLFFNEFQSRKRVRSSTRAEAAR
jgi:microcin C transport system substrate-binding protein